MKKNFFIVAILLILSCFAFADDDFFAPGDIIYIKGNLVNLRHTSSTLYLPVGKIKFGAECEVLETFQDDWLKIKINKNDLAEIALTSEDNYVEGWINTDFAVRELLPDEPSDELLEIIERILNDLNSRDWETRHRSLESINRNRTHLYFNTYSEDLFNKIIDHFADNVFYVRRQAVIVGSRFGRWIYPYYEEKISSPVWYIRFGILRSVLNMQDKSFINYDIILPRLFDPVVEVRNVASDIIVSLEHLSEADVNIIYDSMVELLSYNPGEHIEKNMLIFIENHNIEQSQDILRVLLQRKNEDIKEMALDLIERKKYVELIPTLRVIYEFESGLLKSRINDVIEFLQTDY
jgi:HEAT repeat protein